MKRRLKIYFIHSTKIDYKNDIYRYILSSPICIMHELMLPQTKNYQAKYVKDLINEADIIVAFVDKPTFGLKLELKWAFKKGKPIKYISFDNTIPRSIKKYVPEIENTQDDKPFIKIVEEFTLEYANKSIEELKNTSIVLGDLN